MVTAGMKLAAGVVAAWWWWRRRVFCTDALLLDSTIAFLGGTFSATNGTTKVLLQRCMVSNLGHLDMVSSLWYPAYGIQPKESSLGHLDMVSSLWYPA